MPPMLVGAIRPAVVAAIALSFAADPRAARADVVRMKSGDVVTGTIQRANEEELVIDPDFADEIEIKLKYIATIETKQPVRVTYQDGRERTGFIELDANGKMQVRLEQSRWDAKHGERGWPFAGEPQPPPGTKEPFGELRSIQEIEVAYYRYEADFELGLSAATGNTDSSALDLSASLEPTWGPNAVTLTGRISQQKTNGDLSAKNWDAGLRYQRELPRKWAADAFLTVESDAFQDLNLRSAIAAGPVYRFFDVDPTHFAVGLGLAYVREDFSIAGADRQFPAVAWTLNFERELFSGDLTLFHKHRFLQSLTGDEGLLKTTQGVEIDLWDNLDLKIQFDYDRASDPPPGITEKNDLRYLVKFDLELEGDEKDWLH